MFNDKDLSLTNSNLKHPPIPTYVFHAKVVRVIDADTLVLDASLGLMIHSDIIIRLASVNAYERYTDRGKLATAWVNDLVEGNASKCVIETHKTGKFGRWIADVWFGDFNLNQGLIDNGFAVPYK